MNQSENLLFTKEAFPMNLWHEQIPEIFESEANFNKTPTIFDQKCELQLSGDIELWSGVEGVEAEERGCVGRNCCECGRKEMEKREEEKEVGSVCRGDEEESLVLKSSMKEDSPGDSLINSRFRENACTLNETLKADEKNLILLSNSSKEKTRGDMEVKKAFRLIRKFYKNFFKSNNSEIVRKRYTNCDSSQLFIGMRNMLQIIMPDDLITDDIVHYTIGILGIIKKHKLECSEALKQEVADFLETSRHFTIKKLKFLLKSKRLQTLCRAFITQNNGPMTQILQKFVTKTDPSNK
ncbi:unnamed protein product [Moneuplotes crassus]|uniref:Uncharacterized protein n=1 Tax=Euplotes crassus TaxID=5936 RepID=A0AAD1UBB7_EUPCR|nr:unnamed protein product [Moneuplotes crassus]